LQGQGNFEGIGFIWIHKHRRGKKTKTRVKKKKKLQFDSNNKEEKITYTDVTFSISLLSFLHESILSSQLHKENKNYMKENNKNLSYKLQISLNSTLCLVVLPLPLRLQVFIGEMQRVEEYKDRGR